MVSSNSANVDVKFRALIFSKQGDNQFTYSTPLKISRWLDINRVYSEVHLTFINGSMYLLGKNSSNIFREIQKKQLEFEDFMLPKNLSSDVSLDYVEVEDIVERKTDQLSHQYLYQVKLKGEIDLIWLNAHNFLEPVKYNKRRSQDSLPIKPQFAQKPKKEIKRKRKEERGQSTIPTKIKKKSVNIIQRYSFGPDASLLVEEHRIYKALGLKQEDVTDVLSNCWLSDVHIHPAGILFKKQYSNYPMQLDIHPCKANIYPCCNTMQIHHHGVNHWLLSSNISDTVRVYNSIYKAPHKQEVKNLLFLFYKNFVVDNELVIKYANVMKQVGSNDCGFFCIAYAVDLAEGNDPLNIEYGQSCMR